MSKKMDPITLAAIWYHFQTTCREMGYVLERTAQSYLMAVIKDFSVGIWLADGSTVAVPTGIPCQFMGTKFAIEDIAKKFAGNLKSGDVILTNDPYHGGHNCHLPDWGFIRPIFYKGELLFFAMIRGHQADTGGNFPGGYFPNAYDIHAEGLNIPPIKIVEEDRENTTAAELIWANVRWSEAVRIDNYAMMATLKFAEDRIVSLIEQNGKDTVMNAIQEMIVRTEKAIRAEIASFPDGTYTGEAATDDDGTILDKPVWVRLDLTVKGDEITMDFSRSDPQSPGFINNCFGTAYAEAVATLLCHFDPALADFHNEGSLRPIKVVAKEGTVVNCQYPATVGAGPVAIGTQVQEAVMQAMSKVVPTRSMAAWGKHRGCYTFALDPRRGTSYVRTTFDYDGSAGAVWGYDGATGPSTLATLGKVMHANVEESEDRFPWLILKTEILPDLMGAGRWRGGGGTHWIAVNEGPGGRIATGSSDGDEVQGYGAQGGHASPKGRTYLRRPGELVRVKPHRMVEFKEKDVYIKLSAGGGGVGDPRERDPAAVAKDARNGFITPEGARYIYKVSIDPVTFKVNEALTRKLRAEERTQYEVVINEDTLTTEVRPIATA